VILPSNRHREGGVFRVTVTGVIPTHRRSSPRVSRDSRNSSPTVMVRGERPPFTRLVLSAFRRLRVEGTWAVGML
jgi:hypothetical protein